MTFINNKEVGERINNIRLSMKPEPPRKKMSSEAFGKLLDPPASKNVIRSWEKGVYLPQSHKLKQLAKIGNVSVDFLLYGKILTGYGERIKNIREIKIGTSAEVFGQLFEPVVLPEKIEAWENEDTLPNRQEMKKLSLLANDSWDNIIFGKEEN